MEVFNLVLLLKYLYLFVSMINLLNKSIFISYSLHFSDIIFKVRSSNTGFLYSDHGRFLPTTSLYILIIYYQLSLLRYPKSHL